MSHFTIVYLLYIALRFYISALLPDENKKIAQSLYVNNIKLSLYLPMIICMLKKKHSNKLEIMKINDFI